MGPMAGFLMVCTAGFQVGNLGDRLRVSMLLMLNKRIRVNFKLIYDIVGLW